MIDVQKWEENTERVMMEKELQENLGEIVAWDTFQQKLFSFILEKSGEKSFLFALQLTAVTFTILEDVIILLKGFILNVRRIRMEICREFLIKFHRFLIVAKVTVTIGVQLIEFKLWS